MVNHFLINIVPELCVSIGGCSPGPPCVLMAKLWAWFPSPIFSTRIFISTPRSSSPSCTCKTDHTDITLVGLKPQSELQSRREAYVKVMESALDTDSGDFCEPGC